MRDFLVNLPEEFVDMLSVIQTKFFAFSDRHPIMCRLPLQLFLLLLLSLGWYLFKNTAQSFLFIENAASLISAHPLGFPFATLMVGVSLGISVVVFIREFLKIFQEKETGAYVAIFAPGLLVSIMGTRVAAHFSGTRDLVYLFYSVGVVQLGLFAALGSASCWYIAKKSDMFGKLGLYLVISIFVIMYLLVVVDACRKIF